MEAHLLRMLSLPVAGPPSHAGSPRGGAADPQMQGGGARAPPEPSLVVFSGGTAFNSVAGHFPALTTRVTHVLPVSDDGGSTAEIVRVLGGPAVGDIRSRCLRLAGEAPAARVALAVAAVGVHGCALLADTAAAAPACSCIVKLLACCRPRL